MPIIAITQQPGSAITAKIAAAYRPVVFKVTATRTDGNLVPPVVYCDIYFNSVYYKTLSATQYETLNNTNTEWKFDISDACQEYLSHEQPTNGGSTILNPTRPSAAVFARFRSSGYLNGFQVSEGIPPVRGTSGTQPTAGTGTESNSFHVINSVLQHEDNQDLQTHLEQSRPNAFFNASLFPLTHRPNGYAICKGDSDYFPFVYLGAESFAKLCITYKNKITGASTTACHTYPLTCSSIVSNVNTMVQTNNDVAVTFDSSGPASVWEWTIDGGTTWNVVTIRSFTIVFNDLLVRLITEAGLDIVTEDGEIIIPEDVNPYTGYTITVRPRCANGIYGTSGADNFTISLAATCSAPTVFSHDSNVYDPEKVRLNISIPGGPNFELEWRFDYGGGYVTGAVIESHALTGSPFEWSVPSTFHGVEGSFLFRIRKDCGSGSYSVWSSELSVLWEPPTLEINISLDSISESGGNWIITVSASQASADDITVEGHFYGDSSFGGTVYTSFIAVIPAGDFEGTAVAGNAAPGGSASGGVITNAYPDPTSDGYDLIY